MLNLIEKLEQEIKEHKENINALLSTNQFEFKQYVAKTPIIDNRIILGGNRLFFLEPLEATAIAAYLKWARFTWDWIIEKKVTPEFITNEFHTYINQIQNFILWHYSYGSKYNTPFWKAAKKLKIKDPLFNKICRLFLVNIPSLEKGISVTAGVV